MKNRRLKKYIKLIIISLIVIVLDFTYASLFNKVNAENEESSEVSADAILEGQAESLRHIKLHKRS